MPTTSAKGCLPLSALGCPRHGGPQGEAAQGTGGGHKSRAEPLGGRPRLRGPRATPSTQGRSHGEGAPQTRGPQGNSVQTPWVHTVAKHGKATGQGHPGHRGFQGNTGVAPRGGGAPDTGGPRAGQLRGTGGGHISRAEPLGGCQTHRGPGQLH